MRTESSPALSTPPAGAAAALAASPAPTAEASTAAEGLTTPLLLSAAAAGCCCCCCCCLSRVDGSSLILSDSCRLKGEFAALSCPKPLNEVCRASMRSVAWGLATAWGLASALAASVEDAVASGGAGLTPCGSASRSVMLVCLKDPCRVKAEVLASTDMETAQRRSRCCFFSRQMANAQPTAWLRRSP